MMAVQGNTPDFNALARRARPDSFRSGVRNPQIPGPLAARNALLRSLASLVLCGIPSSKAKNPPISSSRALFSSLFPGLTETFGSRPTYRNHRAYPARRSRSGGQAGASPGLIEDDWEERSICGGEPREDKQENGGKETRSERLASLYQRVGVVACAQWGVCYKGLH